MNARADNTRACATHHNILVIITNMAPLERSRRGRFQHISYSNILVIITNMAPLERSRRGRFQHIGYGNL